ncbi:MAG: queuosine precursor transporter [Gammaproteobacteria bacterium]|nr:queuosine precursor transporter [Gammaproteobacteria bacterium]MYF03065.1 queuosine precursor transporter [Gammaproteobacteria bacterium]MYI78029.1 queuosine precursor transporter [Gammaproteobacteria bacterium]
MREEEIYQVRRQRVFLVLSGIFLGSLAMLNIVGITRFLDLTFHVFGLKIPVTIAVGILPYPVTFLCTDLISELYGRKRAADMVWVGFLVNVWVVFILWLGGVLPGASTEVAIDAAGRRPLFFEIQEYAFLIVGGSMVAYLCAQFCDVHLFHFWKRLTKGKHLWLRNNGSTLVSQLIDTVAVILIAHFFSKNGLPLDPDKGMWVQLIVMIASGYVFKLLVALVDTGPAYLAVKLLRPYLGLKQYEEVYSKEFSDSSVDTQTST